MSSARPEMGRFLMPFDVTYKKNVQAQDAARTVPLDRLLLETDSPVLGPAPGERNEPANVSVVIDAVSEIKNVPKSNVLEALSASKRAQEGLLAEISRETGTTAPSSSLTGWGLTSTSSNLCRLKNRTAYLLHLHDKDSTFRIWFTFFRIGGPWMIKQQVSHRSPRSSRCACNAERRL